MSQYYVTGNESISLPRIRTSDAAIEDFTFLHMGAKGLIDVRGGKQAPLMQTYLSVDGEKIDIRQPDWCWESDWIPTFSFSLPNGIRIRGTTLAPVGERGFSVRYQLENTDTSAHLFRYGTCGAWCETWHCVNEDKPVEGSAHCFPSVWNDSLIFEMRCGIPLFSFAPMPDIKCESAFSAENNAVTYSVLREVTLQSGESECLTIYWGLGFEEVAAATSAKEMLRQGYVYEMQRTTAWLHQRMFDCGDAALSSLYNRNLFFCIFFSTGITLDTEELVLVTSRSPRYYVSAAYWDRDSMLWSFPAILDADPALARRMLLYVFGRQSRNIGTHSRFIDGTVLEPGFELDELMAPVLALERYIQATNDKAFLNRQDVRDSISDILQKLAERKSGEADLYETFLQPTDDERRYPYLTYNNVLVWKGLRAVARLYPEKSSLLSEAENTRRDIYRYCVEKDADGASYFSWSNDLHGHSDVYDEPPGSLQLLAFLGFCDADDPIYNKTVEMIRSPKYKYSFSGSPFGEIGCPHAAHPWLLSIANSLLCGRTAHSFDILRRAEMDNGIVCESIDENSGLCTTGEAFATCAGFVCYAIRTVLNRTDTSINTSDE